MAVTTVRGGQVDPSEVQRAGGGQPLALRASAVRVTSSASGDYSSGVAVASILAACGITAIVQAFGSCYSSANAFKGPAMYDVVAGKLRAYAAVGTEITAANADYYDLIVIGV